MPTFETLRYTSQDGVATISFDQPETRNALSRTSSTSSRPRLSRPRPTTTSTASSSTSTHDKVFSSGANLSGLRGRVPLVHKHFGVPVPERVQALGSSASRRSAPPTGTCWPGALGLALACDLIIAKDEARFGTPEINVGLSRS